MNLVAHQFLSFNEPSLQIGNLLGEVVKGNKYNNYPKLISQGILLHRFIDNYTDQNEIVKQSTAYFHSTQHKYAPIIVDLLYDYFLIKNWEKYSNENFEIFKENCYKLFVDNYNNFPDNLQHIVDHLLKHDWFENYSSLEGIQKTLNGISKRTSFANNLENAFNVMVETQEDIEKEFLQFFPRIITISEDFISKI